MPPKLQSLEREGRGAEPHSNTGLNTDGRNPEHAHNSYRQGEHQVVFFFFLSKIKILQYFIRIHSLEARGIVRTILSPALEEQSDSKIVKPEGKS